MKNKIITFGEIILMLFTRGFQRFDQTTNFNASFGGGDSFMAGLIYGLLTFKNDQKALEFATAASCLKLTIPGDFNLVSVEKLKLLCLAINRVG